MLAIDTETCAFQNTCPTHMTIWTFPVHFNDGSYSQMNCPSKTTHGKKNITIFDYISKPCEVK